MLNNAVETLKQYIDQPSGSLDKEDVTQLAEIIAADFESLGFTVKKHVGEKYGPTLECTIGTGEKTLMLMGHMDTVFPHDVYVPYTPQEDGTVKGSGITDMKGGVVIMLYALKEALAQIDLTKYSIRAIINPDEEIGSPESHDIILNSAKNAFAALSFEPCGDNGRMTCARKGVTSVLIHCEGKPGHAGSQYKDCHSAIQGLCAQLTKLYTLRDDEKDISFNAGFITGGTAENVVAPSAECKCEFRYFNQAYQAVIMDKIRAICAETPVEGVTTTCTFGAAHPAIDLNEKSQELLDIAMQIAAERGLDRHHEKTGGAGDIAIAGQAGIGVLDGFGMPGDKVHTVKEFARVAEMPDQISFAAEMLRRVLK